MIYYVIFIILILPIIFGNGTISNRNKIIFTLILPLFLCCGYMVGSDWRAYEILFQTYRLSEVFSLKQEIGYGLLGYLFRSIGLNFWIYAITIKVIGYYLFLNLYKEFSNRIIGLIFFFANFALFLWIDHPARNFCAIIIYIQSFKYIYTKDFIKYLSLCLLASLFHITAIFFIPIYFLNFHFSKKAYIISLILPLALFFASKSLLPFIVDSILNTDLFYRFNPYLEGQYNENSMNIIRLLFNLGIIILAIFKIDKINTNFKYGHLILNLSIVYLTLFSLGNINIILFRFNLYLAVPFCILLSYIPNTLKLKGKTLYSSIIIAISFLVMQKLITKDFRYIPYSNYFEYTLRQKPTYSDRSNYNFIHSPYRNAR